jgi:hypothetical protein
MSIQISTKITQNSSVLSVVDQLPNIAVIVLGASYWWSYSASSRTSLYFQNIDDKKFNEDGTTTTTLMCRYPALTEMDTECFIIGTGIWPFRRQWVEHKLLQYLQTKQITIPPKHRKTRTTQRRRLPSSSTVVYIGSDVNTNDDDLWLGELASLVQQQEENKHDDNDQVSISSMAYQILQVRELDVWLRVVQCKLLETCQRLDNKIQHQRRHTLYSSGNSQQADLPTAIAASSTIFFSWFGWWPNSKQHDNELEDGRQRLLHLQSTYQKELQRLAIVIDTLNALPAEKPENCCDDNTDSGSTTQSPSSLSWDSMVVQQWIHRAFQTIVQVVDECLQESYLHVTTNDDDGTTTMFSRQEWNNVVAIVKKQNSQAWAGITSRLDQETVEQENNQRQQRKCRKMMEYYLYNIHKMRRLGEGPPPQENRYLHKLRSYWRRWIRLYRRWDVYGIPSSMLVMAGAHVIYRTAVLPYSPSVQHHIGIAGTKIFDIVKERIWYPVKGIWDDLMNRNPGIFSAFGLDVEETTLDHLLRDLGFGNGKASTRHEALRQAAEQYEKDIQSSMVLHTLQGRLPRLMLVQVQQLKVGLLSALDNIDVLLKGNRIHFQLMATVPAILMATYGTRFLARSWYNIRSRDLRSVAGGVHRDMTEYLNAAERTLMEEKDHEQDGEQDEFGDKQMKGSTSDKNAANEGPQSEVNHDAVPLLFRAQVTLCLYRYFIAMESAKGIFSERKCNEIRIVLHHVLRSHLISDRALAWLHLAQQKHKGLLR